MSTTSSHLTSFDHHSPEYAENHQKINADLRAKCPVAHSGAHGGFYVLSKYDDVVAAAKNDEVFASGHEVNGVTPLGVNIPPSPNKHYPIDVDPPEFLPYRKLLTGMLSPKISDSWQGRIRHWVDVCLDQVIETGSFDLVMDLANPVPALFTCEFLGLDIQQWRTYADLAHESVYTPPDQRDDVVRRYRVMLGGVSKIIAERRADPQDDAISKLVTAEIDGAPIPDKVVLSIVNLIMAGGFDTTTAVTANALMYLAEHPDVRQRLIDDPELVPQACEEFLRYYTPQQALARTVTCPVTVNGVGLQPDDRVLLSWASANMDEDTFDQPDEIQIDRFPNRHTSFGVGMHRCVGSHIARHELVEMVTGVLARIPDYELVPGEATKYQTIGIVNGWVNMGAKFTPGVRTTGESLP